NRYRNPVPLPSRPDKHLSVQTWDMAVPVEDKARAGQVSPAHTRKRQLTGTQPHQGTQFANVEACRSLLNAASTLRPKAMRKQREAVKLPRYRRSEEHTS